MHVVNDVCGALIHLFKYISFPGAALKVKVGIERTRFMLLIHFTQEKLPLLVCL